MSNRKERQNHVFWAPYVVQGLKKKSWILEVTEREKLGARLDPALLEWADKVIIPALMREYLAERNAKRIADATSPVSEFTANVEGSARVTP
jgi:hypothetical protein